MRLATGDGLGQFGLSGSIGGGGLAIVDVMFGFGGATVFERAGARGRFEGCGFTMGDAFGEGGGSFRFVFGA